METAMTLSIDDLERLEHILDVVIERHDAFGISLEEAAGRFDRYAQVTMTFAKSDWFFHERSEELAGEIYYGRDEWRDQAQNPWRVRGPEEWARRGQNPPVPKPYP